MTKKYLLYIIFFMLFFSCFGCSALYHANKSKKHANKAVLKDPTIKVNIQDTLLIPKYVEIVDSLNTGDSVIYYTNYIKEVDTIFQDKIIYNFKDIRTNAELRHERKTNRHQLKKYKHQTKRIKQSNTHERKKERGMFRWWHFFIVGLIVGLLIKKLLP